MTAGLEPAPERARQLRGVATDRRGDDQAALVAAIRRRVSKPYDTGDDGG